MVRYLTDMTISGTAYFLNLCVMMKLYLNNPLEEGTDRQALLDFSDDFPQTERYSATFSSLLLIVHT